MRLPLLLLLVKVVGLTNLVVNKGKSWSLCTPALTVPNQPTPVDDSELLAVHLQQLAQVVQLLLHTRHAGCLQLLALTDTQLLLLLLLFARPVTTSRQGWGSCCCRAGVNRAVQQQYHMADIGACLDWKQAATVHAWSTHTHNPAWRLRCTLAHTNKGAAPTNLHKQNIPAGEGIQMGTCMLAVSVRAHTNTHTPYLAAVPCSCSCATTGASCSNTAAWACAQADMAASTCCCSPCALSCCCCSCSSCCLMPGSFSPSAAVSTIMPSRAATVVLLCQQQQVCRWVTASTHWALLVLTHGWGQVHVCRRVMHCGEMHCRY